MQRQLDLFEFKASPVQSTHRVPRLPGLHGETLSQGGVGEAGQQGFEQRLATRMILPLYSACLDMTVQASQWDRHCPGEKLDYMTVSSRVPTVYHLKNTTNDSI